MKLSELIYSYYDHRKMPMPGASNALLFLVSEIGELADAVVHREGTWVRNNPLKDRSIEDEIGDCMQMLTVTAMQLGLDPLECMKAKWGKRGWRETVPSNS